MPDWTPEQKKAIDSRDGTILVSAAAGSGKTAVLVERVLRRLTDREKPCSADKLLIMTFTREATKQMKERIFKAVAEELRKNPEDEHLKKQLIMLPFARISTIDSFCNDIVKANFHALEMSPDYKLLDSAQLKIIENDALVRTLEEFYKEDSYEFNELSNIMTTGTDDKSLRELVGTLYKNSMAFARPQLWLDSLAEAYENISDFPDNKWGRLILSRAEEMLSYLDFICDRMFEMLEKDETVKNCYYPAIAEVAACVKEFLYLVENGCWDEIAEKSANLSFSKMKSLPKGYRSEFAEILKAQKKMVGDSLKEDLRDMFVVSVNEHIEDMEYLRPVVRKLIEIVKRYSEILFEEKQKINSVDFSDITHLALKLLIAYDEDGNPVKTDLAREFSDKFAEILVDEYQDINELQNTLFWAVSKDDSNMFMVGDVKQSIYRFRQAMPEIFLSRRDVLEDYESANYPAKITLDRNFRSRAGVTENINFVFRQIMSGKMGGLDYDEKEALVAAAKYEDCDYPQTELHLVGSLSDSSRVKRSHEAQHVADTIDEIIRSGMLVNDKGTMRPVTYRDFCILIRSVSGGKAETFADALALNNIPAYVSDKTGFFSSTEISTVINLMRVIDNPIQDIPLLAVMLSPIFGFTADELAKMRVDERKKPIYHCLVDSAAKGHKKSVSFLEKLEELRMLSSTLGCSDFVRELYDATGYKAIASALKNGSQRNANLNLLLEYAAAYEESGKRGLSGFIRFIDRVQKQDGDLESASDVSEAANVVRIMTIHKSKGLEFPICILADMSAGFNDRDTKGVAVFHPDYGVGFERRDGRTKCQYVTVGKRVIALAEDNSSMSEELRVLYVAMTRARERLICIARYNNIENKLNDLAMSLKDKDNIPPYVIGDKSNMADWVVTAFLRHPDATKLRALAGREDLSIIDSPEKLTVKIINNVVEPSAEEDEKKTFVSDEALLDEIRERVEYRYPYTDLAFVRAKTAPSELGIQGFDSTYFANKKPSFLSKSGMNPASRGTATHKFMEFFDYTAESYEIDSQTERMLNERLLTESEAAVLEKDKLRKFFSGEIAQRIRRSPQLFREKKVTVGIRAGELYPGLPEELHDETVVVQGYVDCAFVEDGELVVVDYKTDKGVTMEELRDRYASQLKMYEFALAQCTGMKVRGTLIYSFENAEYIAL